MTKTHCRLLVAFSILMTFCTSPFAQGMQEPSITTVPSPPIAGQSFTVKATFLGATPPHVFSYFETISAESGLGYDADIFANGYPDNPLQWGTQELIVPDQPVGRYVIHFVSFGFSPMPSYATFPVTVVAAASAVPLPAISTVGVDICMVLIGLFGVFELRRRGARRALRPTVESKRVCSPPASHRPR